MNKAWYAILLTKTVWSGTGLAICIALGGADVYCHNTLAAFVAAALDVANQTAAQADAGGEMAVTLPLVATGWLSLKTWAGLVVLLAGLHQFSLRLAIAKQAGVTVVGMGGNNGQLRGGPRTKT